MSNNDLNYIHDFLVQQLAFVHLSQPFCLACLTFESLDSVVWYRDSGEMIAGCWLGGCPRIAPVARMAEN